MSQGFTKETTDTDLDINGLTEDSAPATGDYIPFYDTTEGANNKVDWKDATTPSVLAEQTIAFTIDDTNHDNVIKANGTFTITLADAADGAGIAPRAGFSATVINTGTGTLTFSSTDPIRSRASLVTNATQYTSVGLFYDGTEWFLFGELA